MADIIPQFSLWKENGYTPVSSVGSSKSIVDIDISQFRKRGSESLYFCRIGLDLKRERMTKVKVSNLTFKPKQRKVSWRKSSVHPVVTGFHMLFLSPVGPTKSFKWFKLRVKLPETAAAGLRTVPTSSF